MIFMKEKSNFYNYNSLGTLGYVGKQKEKNKIIKNLSIQRQPVLKFGFYNEAIF